MSAGRSDEVAVSFSADPSFSRIGRVTVSGLTLRMGFEVSRVEALRQAMDTVVAALSGRGEIALRARSLDDAITISLANPDATLADVEGLRADVSPLVDELSIDSTSSRVDLTLRRL